MGLLARFKQWRAAREERRTEKLTAKAADLVEGQEYDLIFLHERGFVRAKGSGQSITKIYADVENLIRKQLRVVIKPGTYFVSSGGHQNMATTAEYTFTLYPRGNEHLGISAACINADRPIPKKDDKFLGVAKVSDNVARFLEASRGHESMVIQAGVWTLTDNYSRDAVINHLISTDNHGNTWHPVTQSHCDKAEEILDTLDIPHRLGLNSVRHEKKTESYDNATYVGEFRYGRRHGKGKCTWKSGGASIYEGDWLRGDMHGLGTKVFADGGKYVGEFERNRESGGWFYFKNGSRSWCLRNAKGDWETVAPPPSAQ